MLSQSVQDYLGVRRACGFKLHCQGIMLKSFVSFAQARSEQYVRSATAIAWASLALQTKQRAVRLWIVIRFARYARQSDASHEVPPPVFGSGNGPRRTPYILSQDEVSQLMQSAACYGKHPMLGVTYSTLIGLLACTGLRISEAASLRYADLTCDGLHIRKTKFNKSRLVALHSSTREVLNRYLQKRQTFSPLSDYLFVTLKGTPIHGGSFSYVFRELAQVIGLPIYPARPRATTHSLRHTFAVRSLQNCSNDRGEVARHFVALSTFLGHVSATTTHWYLQATPDLMRDIAGCCECYMGVAP